MKPSAAADPEPGRFAGGRRTERRKGTQAHLAFAMPAPAWNDPDSYAAQLFADVAGTGASSRLFQALREEQGLAYTVSAAAQGYSDCGLFWVYLACASDQLGWAHEEAERVLAGTARDLSPAELNRARALAKAGMMMSLESCWGQASYVANRLLREGRLVEPAKIVARLDAVTLDEVKAAGASDSGRAARAGERRRQAGEGGVTAFVAPAQAGVSVRPAVSFRPENPGLRRDDELGVTLSTLVAEPWADYGLVDSGHGRKLERYGRYRFIRPEPQAMWAPASPDWDADGEFIPGSDEEGGGRWQFARPVPRDGWDLSWDEVRFRAQCTPFRHLAFFPDMAPQWAWMRERLGEGSEALNLFGYTGVGTLAMAAKGARLTHVDASKKSVEAGKANAALSGMADEPIRWMVDDAAKFAAREVRRGRRYDGIILDPPKFGRGPAGEIWRLEEGLPGLIADCRKLLDADSSFLVLTAYAVRMSALAIGELLNQALGDLGGQVECGDMAVREEARGLLLPTAIFARWSR